MMNRTDGPRDYKGRKLEIGDYVLIVEPPSYNGIEKLHLGRVVGGRWFYKDGGLNVDVVSHGKNEHCVNLNLDPRTLRRISERAIMSPKLPKNIDGVALADEYVKLQRYRKGEEFQPIGA